MKGIRHVDLVVTSLEVSVRFYSELLALLGWRIYKRVEGERGEPIVYIASAEHPSEGAVGLREKRSEAHRVPYDRYAVGMHHVAFNAESRAVVDRCGEWLRERHVPIESGPEEYYGSGYYAVFFYDPDGIKLEIVCGE